MVHKRREVVPTLTQSRALRSVRSQGVAHHKERWYNHAAASWANAGTVVLRAIKPGTALKASHQQNQQDNGEILEGLTGLPLPQQCPRSSWSPRVSHWRNAATVSKEIPPGQDNNEHLILSVMSQKSYPTG